MSDANSVGTNGGTTAEPSLHRVMGPWLLLLFIVGDILGTGIYALTGQVANHVGGVVWQVQDLVGAHGMGAPNQIDKHEGKAEHERVGGDPSDLVRGECMVKVRQDGSLPLTHTSSAGTVKPSG